MGRYRYLLLTYSLIIFLLGTNATHAMELKLPFEEVTQTAGLIFIGTVESQECRLNELGTMVLTDVYFEDTAIIHASDKSVQKDSPPD